MKETSKCDQKYNDKTLVLRMRALVTGHEGSQPWRYWMSFDLIFL